MLSCPIYIYKKNGFHCVQIEMTPSSFIFFSLIAVFITEMVILHKYVLLLLFHYYYYYYNYYYHHYLD